MATRRGQLRWKHVHAWVNRGGEAALKGRIAVDRGAGVLEFPTAAQFRTLAREEGIPPDLVDRAFGHLMPKRKKAANRTRAKVRVVEAEVRPWFDWSGYFD